MNVAIPCICDGTPHTEGDTVAIRDSIGFADAIACRTALRLKYQELGSIEETDIMGVLMEEYVLRAPESWTVVDSDGKAVPLTRDAIRDRLLSRPDIAYLIADAADDLYSQAVIVPLLAAGSRSSQPSQTEESTSLKKLSPTTRPTPSSPSSTTTSRTGAIARISNSPDGDSSSSLNSTSAA